MIPSRDYGQSPPGGVIYTPRAALHMHPGLLAMLEGEA